MPLPDHEVGIVGGEVPRAGLGPHCDVPLRPATTAEAIRRSARYDLDDYAFA